LKMERKALDTFYKARKKFSSLVNEPAGGT
jgi:hypothetical protein